MEKFEHTQTVGTFKRAYHPITVESFEEARQGNRAAKLTLIADILSMRTQAGHQPTGDDFNYLFDLPISKLHEESIRVQDDTYFATKNDFK